MKRVTKRDAANPGLPIVLSAFSPQLSLCCRHLGNVRGPMLIADGFRSSIENRQSKIGNYSYRSATMGSTRIARRAGM